ncbi:MULTISPECIES: YtxH domain-containing protein [Planktothrix]|uniref:YtxH domain-containing protein n=1 Tax=Planktothrix mougeotii LEGE 06226 TaxID=1828728 RepID=A0ABR9UEX8_9CYAN|nr:MULTISPECIES: YtxH domain-containing protein [Planktothrix]MBD2484209.1 YtxH domain-containing protein [Planktothrix sp. FACHB-1365]MBE9144134.1 YtxH domain-containing protein [Planktothrix mougeotii LEGE 06226]
MSNQRLGQFLGGFVLGSVVGTVAGLLVAPRSGKETRKLLKKSADALPELAEDLSTNVQLQANRLSESALRNWDETLIRLKESIAAGLEASQQQRQTQQKLEVENHLPESQKIIRER